MTKRIHLERAHVIHMMHVHHQNIRGLEAMTDEERKDWFERTDLIIARTDAIKARDWVSYLAMGGQPTPAIKMLAQRQHEEENMEFNLAICKTCGEWVDSDPMLDCLSCATENWLEYKYGDTDPMDEEV